jgi:hypothetical protein
MLLTLLYTGLSEGKSCACFLNPEDIIQKGINTFLHPSLLKTEFYSTAFNNISKIIFPDIKI